MTDDNTDVTDTMWDQYATALLWEAVGDDFDAATQAFSVSSILLFVGVAAVDPAIANYAVFRLGNNIPPWSGSYIAASNLFTSYWTFLAYIDLAQLAPAPLRQEVATAQGVVRRQLTQVIQDVQRRQEAWTKPARGDPQSESAQLLDLRNLGSKITGLRKAAASRARHQLAQAEGGTDAIDAVIDALSRCQTAASPVQPSRLNMPVKLSATAVDAYVPAYRLPGLAESYLQWQANAEQGIIAKTIGVKADDADASPALARLAALRLPSVPFVIWNKAASSGIDGTRPVPWKNGWLG